MQVVARVLGRRMRSSGRLRINRRVATLAVVLAVTSLVLGAAANAGGSESGTSPVFTIGPPGHTPIADVPGASSTLVRTPNGVSVSLQTSGLPAGYAVTMWALIFNDPSACAVPGACQELDGDLNLDEVQGSVYRVTGHVVGESGHVTFAGHVPLGDAAGARRGPGLLDSYGAETHLIVRHHGVAGTGQLLQRQFNNISPGFCNPDGLENCADIQESIHLAHQ